MAAMENAQENVTKEPQDDAQESAQSNVVRLAEYRRKRIAAKAARTQDWGPQYYCLRCDGDEFKLYASGVVHCAHCGSLMRNLLISGTKAEEAPQ